MTEVSRMSMSQNKERPGKTKIQIKATRDFLPQGAPPEWKYVPLGCKLPMIYGASKNVTLCTTPLGEKVCAVHNLAWGGKLFCGRDAIWLIRQGTCVEENNL